MAPKPHDGVCVVAPGQTYMGKQGFTYGAGASTETVGAKQICMNILPMPPGAVANAHYHKGIETIAYVLEGSAIVHYGDHLEKSVHATAGAQVFVAADIPRAPQNESNAPCVMAVVHASGSDQDGIVMLPELEAELAARG